MKAAALAQAKERLGRAEAAVTVMLKVSSIELQEGPAFYGPYPVSEGPWVPGQETIVTLDPQRHRIIERAWSDFLLAASTIYSKLEQGKKGCNKSEPWFGRKLDDRKNDELLTYIHQARNVDEHSIEPTTEPGLIQEVSSGVNYSGMFLEDGSLKLRLVGEPGSTAVLTFQKLVPVKNRGVTYQPPTTHLGTPIHLASPLRIMQLATTYLSGLIAEAEALPVH